MPHAHRPHRHPAAHIARIAAPIPPPPSVVRRLVDASPSMTRDVMILSRDHRVAPWHVTRRPRVTRRTARRRIAAPVRRRRRRRRPRRPPSKNAYCLCPDESLVESRERVTNSHLPAAPPQMALRELVARKQLVVPSHEEVKASEYLEDYTLNSSALDHYALSSRAAAAAAKGDMEKARFWTEDIRKPNLDPSPSIDCIAATDMPAMRDARRRHNRAIEQAAAARLARLAAAVARKQARKQAAAPGLGMCTDDTGLAAAMIRMGFNDDDDDLKVGGSSDVEGGSSGKGYTGKPGSAPPDAPSKAPPDAPPEAPSEPPPDAPSKAQRRNMRQMTAKTKASNLQQETLDEYARLKSPGVRFDVFW